MLINRNNYETFFLLYADDELRAEERTAVENFVSENEDLRGELKMTLAAVLPADEFLFSLKDSLYKNSFVEGSLQEKLLLKIDNELPAKELNELNKSLATNPSALKEEQLLSTTKLDANEIISCPQKELLYKKERDNVVIFRMVRWVAAAILIGFGLFFGWSLYSKEAIPDNAVAIKPSLKPSNNQKENNIIPNEQNITPISTIINNTEATEETQSNENSIIAVSKKESIITGPVQKNLEVKTKELAANNEVQKTISPNDNIAVRTIIETPTSAIAKVEKVDIAALANDNIVPLETSYVQASFTDNETSNNRILYMDEDDVKRSKVGTAFKKFKRMIERTAKIKTGNPIRIAGFQIGAD